MMQKEHFPDRTFKQVSRRYLKLMERKKTGTGKGGTKRTKNGGDGNNKQAKRQKTSGGVSVLEQLDSDDSSSGIGEDGYESEPDSSTICGLCRGKLTESPRQVKDPMLSSLVEPPPGSLAARQKKYIHTPCCKAADSGVPLVQCSNATTTMFTLSPEANSKKRSSGPRQKIACPHPKYHLACSAIPVGSRLYRDAVTEHYINTCSKSCGKTSSIGGLKVKEDDDRKMAAVSSGKSDNKIGATADGDDDGDDTDRPQTHFEAEQVLRGYLCPYCDVEGTSHYLIEYFEAYRRSKTRFCKDDEAVDRVSPASELGRKCLEYVISMAASSHIKLPAKTLPGGKSKILSPCKMMAIGNGGKTVGAAATVSSASSASTKAEMALQTISEVQLPHIGRLLAGISRDDEEGAGSAIGGEALLDPSFFVGQPIRLYNPIEDAYHVGRIVDWKTVAATTKSSGEVPDSSAGGETTAGTEEDESSRKKKSKDESMGEKPANANVTDTSKAASSAASIDTQKRGRGRPKKPVKGHRNSKVSTPRSRKGTSLSAAAKANERQSIPLDARPLDTIDKAIARTQYLVRFRAGIDGRKVPVHQWMFLEEHAVSVGVGLVWVNPSGQTGTKVASDIETSDNTQEASDVKAPGTISKLSVHYRPAQIVVRSALEMLPVKKLNTFKRGDDVSAMAFFFSRDFHFSVLRFGQGVPDSAAAAIGASGDTDSDSNRPTMVAAHFARPPSDMRKAIRAFPIDDAGLVSSMSMATMEREEQRRVREFHKLSFVR